MQIDRKELIEEYLAHERRQGLSYQGWKSMGRRVPKLFDYLDEIGLDLEDIRYVQAQDYQKWLIETGRKDGGKYTNGTILNYIKGATRFYAFLKETGRARENPFTAIRKVRYEKSLPRNVLKENQLNELLRLLADFDKQKGLYNQIRWYKTHVIAELQYSTGMRISEVGDLKREDIDFDRKMITVQNGKGGKKRFVFLNDYASQVLKLYLDQMQSGIFRDYQRPNAGIFGSGGGRLTYTVNTTLKEASEQLKLPIITNHGFRHTIGFHLLRAGCDLRFIQELLGHERLGTTEIYTKVDRENLKEVLDEFHPRKWREKA